METILNKESRAAIELMVADGIIAKDVVERYFPELKESEGEKIKRILHSISSKMGSHLRDIFTEEEFQCFDAWSNAWLKKQCEQKEIDYNEELKKCKANPLYFFDKYVKVKLKEQKPVWSEEDENEYIHILKTINLVAEEQETKGYNNLVSSVNWLKSLKERYAWKPSDEQMDAIKDAIDYLGGNTKIVRKHLMSLYDQLKKLREEQL